MTDEVMDDKLDSLFTTVQNKKKRGKSTKLSTAHVQANKIVKFTQLHGKGASKKKILLK